MGVKDDALRGFVLKKASRPKLYSAERRVLAYVYGLWLGCKGFNNPRKPCSLNSEGFSVFRADKASQLCEEREIHLKKVDEIFTRYDENKTLDPPNPKPYNHCKPPLNTDKPYNPYKPQ